MLIKNVAAFALNAWCLGFTWISRKDWIRPCRLWCQLITVHRFGQLRI